MELGVERFSLTEGARLAAFLEALQEKSYTWGTVVRQVEIGPSLVWVIEVFYYNFPIFDTPTPEPAPTGVA